MKHVDHESTAHLLRSVLALGRRLRAARVPGSHPLAGLTILGALYRVGPLLASQIAAEEGLQPQSLTRLLAELERKKLIDRKRSATDGRAQIVSLTALGRRRLLDEIGERRAWLQTAMAEALTPEEREIARTASAVLLKIATHAAPGGRSAVSPAPKKPGRVFGDESLTGATFRNVNLEKAAFTDVNLRSAAFNDINFSGATFTNVNLGKVAIRNANVAGMTINGEPVVRSEAASSSTVFHVSQLGKSLAFYTRVLEFSIDFTHGTPETYAGLSWRGVHLHLGSAYPYRNNTGHGNLYIRCVDIDPLYERLAAAGADFYSRIADRLYGMRDFSIKDPDGNQLGFGAPLTPTR